MEEIKLRWRDRADSLMVDGDWEGMLDFALEISGNMLASRHEKKVAIMSALELETFLDAPTEHSEARIALQSFVMLRYAIGR